MKNKTMAPVVFTVGGQWPLVAAGLPFFLFGFFFLWKAIELYLKNSSSGFVMGGAAIGLLFAGFGGALIFLKLSTVIDPVRRTVAKTKRFLFWTHTSEFSINDYNTVLLEEKIQDNGRRRFQFFRVSLSKNGEESGSLYIDQESEYAVARSKADTLADSLGLKLVDRGCGEESVPSAEVPAPLKQPASSRVTVSDDGKNLSIHIPRRKFDDMHRLYVILVFVSTVIGAVTVFWAVAQLPARAFASPPGVIFISVFSSLCLVAPIWGSFLCLRSATRRYDVTLGQGSLNIQTRSIFGTERVSLHPSDVKDIQVRRSQYAVRVPGLENEVLRVVGNTQAAEIGSGLTRKELRWLQSILMRRKGGRL